MGLEIQVDSLEDMCALMCDNVIPAHKREEPCYIFTFGYGHEHAGYYVKVYGSYNTARRKMWEKYGDAWAFQYSYDEWQEQVLKGLATEVELETL